MATSSPHRLRRDAAASVFVYGVAGVALVVHAVNSVGRWSGTQVALDVVEQHGRARTLLVTAADVPTWAVTTLRVADVVEWVGSAAVLVMLSMCVVGMLRGDVFTRSTARWATSASWTVMGLVLAVPLVARTVATNVALQDAREPARWDAHIISTEWWYLYIGAMTLSFLALVLRRGSQLQQDQDGLI